MGTEENRKKFVLKLMARIQTKRDEMFITANHKEVLNMSMEESSMLEPKTRTKKSKIDLAIKSAEQYMGKYLSNLKDSFVF